MERGVRILLVSGQEQGQSDRFRGTIKEKAHLWLLPEALHWSCALEVLLEVNLPLPL